MITRSPIHRFIKKHYHYFNSGSLMRATEDYIVHLNKEGKMMLTIAGAMSSARLGISIAPLIRNEKIHIVSCTGANLEESVFQLVAHEHYKNFPDYRYFRKEDDQAILEAGHRRVTDMSIPEEDAFRKIEPLIVEEWLKAQNEGKRYFPHEYFYKVLSRPGIRKLFEGNPKECWLLEAAKLNLPIIVGGWEDSTLGNIFAGYCKEGLISPNVMKSGVEYMMFLYDAYQELSQAPGGLGFFQIGGGLAGDFPICVVPSIKYDLKKSVRPWTYFCQISDSTTSYGSYSGATPNEKITWDKLTTTTPMHIIESDATIVFPLVAMAVLEMTHSPNEEG
jgi:deoxyhypusine synthase